MKKMEKKRSNKRYVNTDIAAKILCKAPGTLHNDRFLNRGPKYIKMPGRTGKVLYDINDLIAYMESRKIQPVNEV